MPNEPAERGEQADEVRRQFVWRYGILGWGLPTGFLFALTRSYSEGWDQFPVILTISLVLFPFGGIVVGRGLWSWRERAAAKNSTAPGRS